MGTQTTQLKFHKFDLVWAKILGWPWWPGRVTDIPSKNNGNYKVEFIADPSQYECAYAQCLLKRGKATPLLRRA